MPTLSEENSALRQKVTRLEQALGRATFELSRLSKRLNAESLALACEEVVACLSVGDASQAIAFYSQVFGAQEAFRVNDGSGKVAHAALRLGNSQIFISSEYPELGKLGPDTLGGSSVAITVFVDDAQTTFQKALGAGCTSVIPVKQTFWGDLVGTVRDPFGHQWTLSTNTEQLSVSQILNRAEAATRTAQL